MRKTVWIVAALLFAAVGARAQYVPPVEEDVKAREDLNFKWLDFTEEDDRSVADILDEMQDEADGISAAVAQLKELLGGIEI